MPFDIPMHAKSKSRFDMSASGSGCVFAMMAGVLVRRFSRDWKLRGTMASAV